MLIVTCSGATMKTSDSNLLHQLRACWGVLTDAGSAPRPDEEWGAADAGHETESSSLMHPGSHSQAQPRSPARGHQ